MSSPNQQEELPACCGRSCLLVLPFTVFWQLAASSCWKAGDETREMLSLCSVVPLQLVLFKGPPICKIDFTNVVSNNNMSLSVNSVERGESPSFACFACSVFQKMRAKTHISGTRPFSDLRLVHFA